MAKKAETSFRINIVYPALDALPNTAYESIQQVAINGSFDIILSINGVFVGLELKDVGEELRPLQAYKAEKFRSVGKGRVYMADKNNWNEVHAELLKLAQGGQHGKPKVRKSRKI